MADGKAAGKPRSGLDMIIAAVAGANACVLVTDNEKDFAGVQLVNPNAERSDAVALSMPMMGQCPITIGTASQKYPLIPTQSCRAVCW